MINIPLTRGKVAIIDSKDFNYINQFNWCYSSKGVYSGKEYGMAQRGIWNKKTK